MPLGVVGRSKRMTHQRQTSYDPQQYPSPRSSWIRTSTLRGLRFLRGQGTNQPPITMRAHKHTHQRQLTSLLGLPPASPWWFAFSVCVSWRCSCEPKMRIVMEGHRKHLVLRMCAKGGFFGVFCVENGIPRQVEGAVKPRRRRKAGRPTLQCRREEHGVGRDRRASQSLLYLFAPLSGLPEYRIAPVCIV